MTIEVAPNSNSQPPVEDALQAGRGRGQKHRFGLSAKISIWTMLFGVVTAIGVVILMYNTGARTISEIETLANTEAMQRVAVRLNATTDQLRQDALILSKTPPIQGILRSIRNDGIDPLDGSSRQLWQNRLAQIFESFLETRQEYLQVRFIADAGGGMEIVRVEKSGDIIRRSPAEDLQEKAVEPYYRATAALAEGRVYLSKIDLNKEFGVLETPYRPTVRAATPIYSDAGKFVGMIVINADAGVFFSRIAAVLQKGQSLLLANDAGDYLYHPDEGLTFGFQRGQRHRIQDQFPVLAASGFDFTGKVQGEDGEQHLFSQQVAFDRDQPDRFLTIGLLSPVHSPFNQIFGQYNGLVIFITAAWVLLGAVFSAFRTGHLVRSLKELAAAARRLGQGAQDIDLSNLQKRDDEIGDLAQSFVQMVDKIQARETQLLEQAEALSQSNSGLSLLNTQLSAVMENALDGLIVIDEKAIIQSFNPAACHMFGYTAKEVIGEHASLLVPERFHTRNETYLQELLAAEDANVFAVGREVLARRKDGTEFPIELGISPMFVGKKRMFLGMTSDLSRRKAIERQKEQRFIEDLRRSNEELSQFAYVASHDLQEPLRVVGSYVDLLARRYQGKLDAEADEFIAYAVDGVTRMKALINDILGYSRVSHNPISQEQVDTSTVVARIERSLASRIKEADGKLEHGTLPVVLADSVQVERLFRNLIDNAVKYRSKNPLSIQIEANPQGDRWAFSIRDNGIGIDPQFKDKVFGIFTRLHGRDTYAGTGIGLASCRRIVERHGGEITVEQAPGGGSIFRFTLPKG